MIKLTADNLKNAISRAFEERNFARRVAENTYVVECPRGHEHLVKVEGDAITCDCEAGKFGKHACHHQASALALHLAITEGRTGRAAGREPAVAFLRERGGKFFCGPIQV